VGIAGSRDRTGRLPPEAHREVPRGGAARRTATGPRVTRARGTRRVSGNRYRRGRGAARRERRRGSRRCPPPAGERRRLEARGRRLRVRGRCRWTLAPAPLLCAPRHPRRHWPRRPSPRGRRAPVAIRAGLTSVAQGGVTRLRPASSRATRAARRPRRRRFRRAGRGGPRARGRRHGARSRDRSLRPTHRADPPRVHLSR